jgi:hypothetical protein
MHLKQQEKLHHRCQLKLTTYSPSFPTCLSHPRKYAPSLLRSPLAAPFPFWDFNNGLDKKSQSHVAVVWHLREINPQQFYHLDIISHEPDNSSLQYPTCLTTCFFSLYPNITKYRYKHRYGFGIGLGTIHVQ